MTETTSTQQQPASALAVFIAAIDQALPQTQCTRCGYPDCRRYAEAVADGSAAINQCPPGGQEGVRRLASIKDSTGKVIGNRTKGKVVKNKVAPPFTEGEFDILYAEGISRTGAVIDAQWPQVDESALVQDSLTLVIQVNGKLRGQIEVPASATREAVEAAARGNENVLRFTEGLTIRKVIVVPGKLVNIVAN